MYGAYTGTLANNPEYASSLAGARISPKRSEASENKWLFDRLQRQREAIEGRFGASLEWLRLEDKKASRIAYPHPFDGFNESNWPEMVAWLCEHIVRLEAAFSGPMSQLNRQLKSGIDSAAEDGSQQT